MLSSSELCHLVIQTLDENKGLEIRELDVTRLTQITDYIIVCSATSSRHANALIDKVIQKVAEKNIRPLGVEGQQSGEWILLDLQDIILHVMLPEVREFYSLEKLWTVTKDYERS